MVRWVKLFCSTACSGKRIDAPIVGGQVKVDARQGNSRAHLDHRVAFHHGPGADIGSEGVCTLTDDL
jgi:hypothetical protein